MEEARKARTRIKERKIILNRVSLVDSRSDVLRIVKEIKALTNVAYSSSVASLEILKFNYRESILNESRSITEPQVGHLAAMCCEILRARGEEGLNAASA